MHKNTQHNSPHTHTQVSDMHTHRRSPHVGCLHLRFSHLFYPATNQRMSNNVYVCMCEIVRFSHVFNPATKQCI